MYSIAERTQLSKRIAQISKIDTYRTMLRSHGSKRAGRIILDQQQLAESLVYELLGKMTAEDILAHTTTIPSEQATSKVAIDAIPAVKKKHRSLKSILLSVGKILKAPLSRQQT